MSEAELVSLQAQVTQLQQRAEQQSQAWRKLGMVSGGLALALAVMALVSGVASVWFHLKSFPTAQDFAQTMTYQFLLTSLTLSLLTQALRTR